MSNDERIGVCVLAGCDYVGSIKGVGIKKAIKMMDNDKDIMEILRKFKIDRIYGDRVPDNY
jgi:exonuclease-1